MAKQISKKSAAPKEAAADVFDEQTARKKLIDMGLAGEDGGKLKKDDTFYVTKDYCAFTKDKLGEARSHARAIDSKLLKIIFGFLLMMTVAFSASAQYYVNWPFAAADEQDITDSDSITVTIENAFTIYHADTGALSQAVTELNLDADDELPVGSVLIIFIEQGSTGRNVAMGSEFDTVHAPDLTGVANDKDILVLYWTGTVWVAVTAAWQKIVDAA